MPRLPIKLKVALGLKYRFGFKVSVKRNRKSNGEKARNESEGSGNDTARTNKPYVGQFWPLQPAMTGHDTHKPRVIVVILGDRAENDQESCFSQDEPNELYTPNTVPCLPEQANLMEENYTRRDGCGSTSEKSHAISQDCFLDKCASTPRAFSSEKIAGGHNRVEKEVRSGLPEENRSKRRHRFKSSTETPLTEEELTALELDISEPLDVLGIIMDRLSKRSCEQ